MPHPPTHQLEVRGNSGSAFKWVVDNKSAFHLPQSRGIYIVGLKQVTLATDLEIGPILHVCLSPPVKEITYLQNNMSLACLKTFLVSQNPPVMDFTGEMEYFFVDFNSLDQLTIELRNNQGVILDVHATIVLEMYEA